MSDNINSANRCNYMENQIYEALGALRDALEWPPAASMSSELKGLKAQLSAVTKERDELREAIELAVNYLSTGKPADISAAYGILYAADVRLPLQPGDDA